MLQVIKEAFITKVAGAVLSMNNVAERFAERILKVCDDESASWAVAK